MFKIVIESAANNESGNTNNLCVERFSNKADDTVIKFTIYPDDSGEYQNSVTINRTDLIKAIDFLFSK